MKTYTYIEKTRELAEIYAYGIAQMCFNDGIKFHCEHTPTEFVVIAEMPWGTEKNVVRWE